MKRVFKIVLLFISLSFYGQNDTISVVRHSDSGPVFSKKSKVVYRGIRNELVIEVPNCKSFKANGDGLKLIKDNTYHLFPNSGTHVIITLDITLHNNKKIIEKHSFEIKRTSGFVTTINGSSGLVRMQKNHFKDAKIKVRFEDKNLILLNSVTAFSLKIPGYPAIQVIGNKIDSSTYQKILNNASIGDQIVISDIKKKIEDKNFFGAGCFLTGPIVIEIY